VAQDSFPGVPTQVLTVLPFVLMILVLVLTSASWLDRLLAFLPSDVRRKVLQTIRATPPAALGKPFVQD
jgi:simple sugar transport system permease protein